jgi:hypothetical protein
MKRALSPRQIWAAPLALATASALGLVSALLADGAGDALGWLALGAPVIVVGCCALPGVQRSYLRRHDEEAEHRLRPEAAERQS